MSTFDALKGRLTGRSDSEHEQALLRIVIVGLFLGYMAVFHGWPGHLLADSARIVAILGGFLGVAVAIFAAICVSPAPSVPRRLIGMVADCAGCTWYMWVAGDYGFFVIGVYLFITFGNGFRYGRRYLFGCQLLCLAGLTCVLLVAPYWERHQIAGAGLLTALIVLPLYVSTLLKRIQEARARAEEANLAKSTFLANMSHEMRTPLNGIVGVVDLLNATSMSTHQNELVGLLRHSISVLRSLVDDVLDISKIEAGQLTVEIAPFDLHACVNGLVHLLRPHAESKGLSLHAVIDPELDYQLRGDAHHLRQILLNLLGNAIKFTERGEVSLVIALARQSPGGVTARFEVRDTGIGISPEAVPRIFERFVQADQSTTRKYGGTGLGTTIAKQLTELMGGNIGVASKLGEGSTFWVELPFLHDGSLAGLAAPEVSEFGQPNAADGVVLLIADVRAQQLTPAIRSLGLHCEVIPSSSATAARIEDLTRSGVPLRAIVAACPIEQACAAFNVVAQRPDRHRVALIYVADDDLSVVDRARVNSIPGAFALPHASGKLIANAMHAVDAFVEKESAESAGLAAALHRDRVPLKILVAEDNQTNQRIILQLLEGAGHQVLLASDGEIALDIYEREQPDMAILDFNMPHRSGVEAVQAIRLMEAPGVHMPTIILSASVTPDSRRAAIDAGADGYIGKPFDAVALIGQIDHLAERTMKVRNGNVSAVPGIPMKRTNSRHAPPPAELHGSAVRERQRPPNVNNAPGKAQIIDGKRLEQLEDIARDRTFLAELIRGFCADVESILTRTADAVRCGSRAAIPDLMHTLKGAAVSVGADQLAGLAVNLEAHVPEMAQDQLESALQAIRTSFAATSAYLRDYLQAHHHAAI